jgi:hypothetical protein
MSRGARWLGNVRGVAHFALEHLSAGEASQFFRSAEPFETGLVA